MSEDEERAVIARCIASIQSTSGVRPVGWHVRGYPSVNTRRLLVEEGGFLYDSDAYNDDLPYFVQVGGKPHLVVPYSFTYNDARFVAGTGYGSPADFLDNLRRGFDQLWDEGASAPRMMSIGLHPRLVGQASRAHALAEFLDHARAKGAVWFTTRLEIARWWQAHHREFDRPFAELR
jgi:peptidoglycan/xylan/chitin deacetylase (PgdA/CDA1 family)